MEIADGTLVDTTLSATLDFIRRHPARFEEQARVNGQDIEFRFQQRAGALAGATALEREHIDGSTEPWIQDILVALLHGLQRYKPTVLHGAYERHACSRPPNPGWWHTTHH